MDGACNMCGGDELCTKFWSENLKGGDHFEGLGRIDGMIMLKWNFTS
jgi:hypothetical protein